MQLDPNTEFGQRVKQRLATEHIIWLTTTGSEGTPQPRPVWFIWENETILVYSEPKAQKIKHVARQPKVALHFNSASDGGDIVVFTGEAQVVVDAPSPDKVAAYLEKYLDGIVGLGMTAEEFGRTYSAALRITPSQVRGF